MNDLNISTKISNVVESAIRIRQCGEALDIAMREGMFTALYRAVDELSHELDTREKVSNSTPLDSNLFSYILRAKRNKKSLREASIEIGISHATLNRVESGNIPDLYTFQKLARWLALDTGFLLECVLNGSIPNDSSASF